MEPLRRKEASAVSLVMADSRNPWPPEPSPTAHARLTWEPTYYSSAVALAALYAARHCYDLRVYRILQDEAELDAGGLVVACTHPTLGRRASSWCKLLAIHDTLWQKSVLSGWRYTHVVWVDSDLFFHDQRRSVHQLLDEYSVRADASTFAWFPTNYPWNDTRSKRFSPVNAGVVFLRNSVGARRFIRRWWDFDLGRRKRKRYNRAHDFEQVI
jgi:hypothetical protein